VKSFSSSLTQIPSWRNVGSGFNKEYHIFGLRIVTPKRDAAISALGQKRTFSDVQAMSALPPKADIRRRDRHVRFVPKAEIEN